MSTPLIIVSAPSGAGKSSLCDRALTEYQQLFDTTTFTTRPMRAGESEGKPYHFVTKERFQELLGQSFFVEHAVVHGQLYGTPLYQLEDAWKAGRFVIMDVDVQGAKTFKRLFPNSVTIFIMPPSIDELRQRITRRDQGRTPDLEVRLKNAEREIQESAQYDYVIVNDDFDKAYTQFKKIIEEIVTGR